jgi:hypothetical protein
MHDKILLTYSQTTSYTVQKITLKIAVLAFWRILGRRVNPFGVFSDCDKRLFGIFSKFAKRVKNMLKNFAPLSVPDDF